MVVANSPRELAHLGLYIGDGERPYRQLEQHSVEGFVPDIGRTTISASPASFTVTGQPTTPVRRERVGLSERANRLSGIHSEIQGYIDLLRCIAIIVHNGG